MEVKKYEYEKEQRSAAYDKIINIMMNKWTENNKILVEEREDEITVKTTSTKSKAEKLKLLEELAGSALEHDKDLIDESIRTANREDEWRNNELD